MWASLIAVPLLLGQSSGTDAGLQPYSPSFSEFKGLPNAVSLGKINRKDYNFPAGTKPDQILTLGDIQQTGVGKFKIGQIAGESGVDIGSATLKDFPLLANSSLDQVAKATGDDPGFLNNILIDGNTVQGAINAGEGAKTLAEKIGIDTQLKDINKVSEAVIEELNDWEQEIIANVPGLSQVPFARFPAQVANTSFASISLFAKADLILDRAEQGINNTITGSEKEKTKFNTPCIYARQQVCGHLELKDFVSINMAGKRWINGKHQKVRGGSGALGALFDYKEPTGRLPFGKGSPFKLVLTRTEESDDTFAFSAYFRVCQFLAGCTPYVIGPFPLYGGGVDSIVWLGFNVNDFGALGFGFDPAIIGPPSGSTAGLPGFILPGLPGSPSGLPNGSTVGRKDTGGFGDPGRCADANRTNPQYLWPARGVLTSGFGYRTSPGGFGSSYHRGIDVAAPTGTPIVAGEGGVIEVSEYAGGLGYAVFLRIECTGHQLRYGHNSQLLVTPGQAIKKGQVIALMGSTGLSTGPHSHFEVRIGGNPVDPQQFLSGSP